MKTGVIGTGRQRPRSAHLVDLVKSGAGVVSATDSSGYRGCAIQGLDPPDGFEGPGLLPGQPTQAWLVVLVRGGRRGTAVLERSGHVSGRAGTSLGIRLPVIAVVPIMNPLVDSSIIAALVIA